MKMLKKVFILFLFSVPAYSIEVKTSSGTVKGKTLNILSKHVNQFLNIPYAEPPVGKLRFSKPVPIKDSIKGIIDGTHKGNSCMQTAKDKGPYSEDCLVLNIFSGNSGTSKPVMFWIHGGGFRGGSSFAFNGSALATYDVVVVTVNYRLGPFGFLYGGSESAPGNVGLYDQLLALKWVKQNIHHFGGDPNLVTIFGESAGSWSTSAHVLSPLSKGLFKRAILESGAIYDNKISPRLTKASALEEAVTFSKHFNCSGSQWLDCLRGIDAKALNSYHSVQTYAIHDTEFLPLIAQKAFKSHIYSTEIDIMSGVMQNEGSSLAHGSFPESEHLKNAEEFKEFIKKVHFPELDYHKISEFYLKNIDTNSTEALKKAFYDFYGDIHIACPCYHFAKAFAENNPKRNVNFYQWTYLSENMRSRSGCKKDMGICHGSENGYVFGAPVLENMSDKHFSEEIMKIWTNFAKNGNPLDGFPNTIHWPRMTVIGSNKTKIKEFNPSKPNEIIENLFEKTCDGFWKNYFN